MSEMVQVALADDATEAEEIQALLEDAGIESAGHPGRRLGRAQDPRSEDAVESAQDVIELAPADEETTPEL